jgi:hypothetical protein
MSEAERQREIARCRWEIAAARAELLAGNPDVEGLCLALADWSAELRLLEDEKRRRALNPAAILRNPQDG